MRCRIRGQPGAAAVGGCVSRRATSDLGPGGKAEGPGWIALRRKTETDQGWELVPLGQLEVQVAGELWRQETLRKAWSLGLLATSGPQGLLGDLQSFWGGERGTGGDEEGWRAQGGAKDPLA